MALAGAMGKSMGAQAASAKAVSGKSRVSQAKSKHAGNQLTDDPGERLQSVLVYLGLGSKYKGTSSIVQVTSIGSSDCSILDEDRLQSSDLVGHDLLELLILNDNSLSLSINNGDRGDFSLESSGCPSCGGTTV